MLEALKLAWIKSQNSSQNEKLWAWRSSKIYELFEATMAYFDSQT